MVELRQVGPRGAHRRWSGGASRGVPLGFIQVGMRGNSAAGDVRLCRHWPRLRGSPAARFRKEKRTKVCHLAPLRRGTGGRGAAPRHLARTSERDTALSCVGRHPAYWRETERWLRVAPEGARGIVPDFGRAGRPSPGGQRSCSSGRGGARWRGVGSPRVPLVREFWKE